MTSNDGKPVGSSYPTADEVDAASHEQLARWMRFLPSPGEFAVSRDDRDEFERAMVWESAILNRIVERFNAAGRWNPVLSKKVGW